MRVVPLCEVPEYLQVIGTWIYDAFWQESDKSVDYILGLLREHLQDQPIPRTFVAVDNQTPVGSVSFIESDMAERPDLTPWLAALYVLPAYRRQGIGSLLVNTLVNHAQQVGFDTLYLSADDQVHLYASLGWRIIETEVGPNRLTIMQKHCTGAD